MLDLQDLTDPIPLARRLIQAPSVTPVDAGALDVLSDALTALGFECKRFPFDEVDNLYARLGTAEPVFCFAGHTDVVPSGPEERWQFPPFEAANALQALKSVGSSHHSKRPSNKACCAVVVQRT